LFQTRTIAGWSSLVARRAHNPKVVGSNPAPATILKSQHLVLVFFCLYYLLDAFITNTLAHNILRQYVCNKKGLASKTFYY
jgi:hypothetical protein